MAFQMGNLLFYEGEVSTGSPYYTVCPKEFAHASLGNLEVLHQKADGSTIVFTHCEQENEIT